MNDMNPGATVCAVIEGHQTYREVVGEVVMWGHTVTQFGSGKVPLQVPCVILLVSNDPSKGPHTVVVPLIEDGQHATVTAWPRPAKDNWKACLYKDFLAGYAHGLKIGENRRQFKKGGLYPPGHISATVNPRWPFPWRDGL